MNALMPRNTALLNKKILKQVLSILLMSTFLIVFAVESAKGSSRIKDITSFEGVRENMLVGYGLVVGLNGTGDTLATGGFTRWTTSAVSY